MHIIYYKTRLQYDNMKKPTKGKLISFLEKWFNKKTFDNTQFKTFLNFNEKSFETIINNIEAYDFNDILGLFNNMIIPTKKNDTIDCSDTDTPYWDQTCAEYYNMNELPLKYHTYNSNNITLNLKCTIDDISNNITRRIKLKRKQEKEFIETIYYFNCSNQYIVFNNGGDDGGHLIICLALNNPYVWSNNNIYYMIDINLYQYIYGIEIAEFNIKNWIPYKEGNIINIKYINNFILSIKLNIKYTDTIDNKNTLLLIN